MINARPNNNGNTKESFETHARSILSAVVALEDALLEAGEVFHGRNYQTVDNPGVSRDLDVEKYTDQIKGINQLKDFATDVYLASKG